MDYADLHAMMASQSFDDGRNKVASRVVRLVPLTCNECISLLRMFSFDDGRVEFIQTVCDSPKAPPMADIVAVICGCMSFDDGRTESIAKIHGVTRIWTTQTLISTVRTMQFDDGRTTAITYGCKHVVNITSDNFLTLLKLHSFDSGRAAIAAPALPLVKPWSIGIDLPLWIATFKHKKSNDVKQFIEICAKFAPEPNGTDEKSNAELMKQDLRKACGDGSLFRDACGWFGVTLTDAEKLDCKDPPSTISIMGGAAGIIRGIGNIFSNIALSNGASVSSGGVSVVGGTCNGSVSIYNEGDKQIVEVDGERLEMTGFEGNHQISKA